MALAAIAFQASRAATMPPKVASQQAWTLRFKNHKTTVLLLVQATQSFDTIKEDLLSSIKATGVKDINGSLVPSEASEIILGVPIEKHDPRQGWVDLEIKAEDGDGKSSKKGSVLNENPMGAGLKDGALLAFRFAEEQNDWNVVMPSYEDEESMHGQAQT